MFAWSQGLLARARLDKNDALENFSKTLERVIIETVENGHMTKDLALLIQMQESGGVASTQIDRSKYLNTFEFIDKVQENLNKALTQ